MMNRDKLDKFNRKLIEREDIRLGDAMRIYEELHAEAVSLGVISSDNIMDGIEVDIRLAKALNSLK